jgi:hypothetical protein
LSGRNAVGGHRKGAQSGSHGVRSGQRYPVRGIKITRSRRPAIDMPRGARSRREVQLNVSRHLSCASVPLRCWPHARSHDRTGSTRLPAGADAWVPGLPLVVRLYNLAKHAAALVGETCASYELQRVDDGGSDATLAQARWLCRQAMAAARAAAAWAQARVRSCAGASRRAA